MYLAHVDLMLGQRRRRRTNFKKNIGSMSRDEQEQEQESNKHRKST